ncbi:MAG TPA: alpha/beta fold hydrolase [Candidatus Dormibacteraeota bacterium]|nr:alpha/beta fold hydrolase [Candidatus Dormibacteraeota bacterium]
MRDLAGDFWSYPPEPEDLLPFRLGEGRVGALLIHGFCGTPPEMRGLGEHLAARGLRVHGALLAGHGTSPEALERSTWRDWVDSAQAQLDELRGLCDAVVVAGQSMGGAISLLLAARNPDVAAVATMAAIVRLPRRTEALIRVGSLVRHWHYPDHSDVDLWEPANAAWLKSYSRRSLRSHIDLLTLMGATVAALPAVRCPALVMHGLRDRTVPPDNARLIASRCAGPVDLRFFERSGHGMTVDVDREPIFELVGTHFRAAAGLSEPEVPITAAAALAASATAPQALAADA